MERKIYMKKWIVSMVILVVVIGGGFTGYSYFANKGEAASAPQVQTLTAAAEVGNVEVNVSGTGNISVINEEIIAADENATVEEVLVAVGDTVEVGAELITFEDDDVDPIVAPFAGEITALNVEAAMDVQTKTELVEVTDYTNLEMVVNIDELDVSKIQVGQTATIDVNALTDKEFTGTVTSVSKEATEDSSSTVAKYGVNIKINEHAGIKVGMTAEATITTEKKENVVTVPVAAIQKQNDSYYVLIPSQDQTAAVAGSEESSEESTIKTTQKPVEIGMQNSTLVEIVSGLAEGDEVVLPSLNTENSTQGGNAMFPGSGGFPGGNMGQRPEGGMPRGDRGQGGTGQ
ncbi:efflux RND transporter periplasmic adaptor subunit [Neobacillus niacini]|uniref:efflux RND transporter periplasmic adaptor subunit n=1 Tax=Neobacillus niacini TaxID=86668 RepID=UPI002FFDF8BD